MGKITENGVLSAIKKIRLEEEALLQQGDLSNQTKAELRSRLNLRIAKRLAKMGWDESDLLAALNRVKSAE